jgi:hypothetical protein
MTLTILDPCTGARVKVEVPVRPQAARRVRRWILRELDQAAGLRSDAPRSSYGEGLTAYAR